MKKKVTASSLYNFKKCSHRPYLDMNGAPSLKSKIHPLVQMLWDAGVQHEADVINYLKNKYPNKSFVEIDPAQPVNQDLLERRRSR